MESEAGAELTEAEHIAFERIVVGFRREHRRNVTKRGVDLATILVGAALTSVEHASSVGVAMVLLGSMRSAQAIYVARPAPRGRRPDGVGGT